jgi:hypothetical protein
MHDPEKLADFSDKIMHRIKYWGKVAIRLKATLRRRFRPARLKTSCSGGHLRMAAGVFVGIFKHG